MLELDPERRISCNDALQHEWLKDVDPESIPPPPGLPKEGCHEMWSKRRKREQQAKQQDNSHFSAVQPKRMARASAESPPTAAINPNAIRAITENANSVPQLLPQPISTKSQSNSVGNSSFAPPTGVGLPAIPNQAQMVSRSWPAGDT